MIQPLQPIPIVETRPGLPIQQGAASDYFRRWTEDLAEGINAVELLVADVQEMQAASDGFAGVETVTPDASGYALLPYTAGAWTAAIERCSALAIGATFFHVQMISVDSTDLTVRLFNASGTPITSGSFDVAYKVAGA